MGLYTRFCKRFFAAVIVRLTAQADSRALVIDLPSPRNHRRTSFSSVSPSRLVYN